MTVIGDDDDNSVVDGRVYNDGDNSDGDVSLVHGIRNQ